MNLKELFQEDYIVNLKTGRCYKPLGLVWWLHTLLPAVGIAAMITAVWICAVLFLPFQ